MDNNGKIVSVDYVFASDVKTAGILSKGIALSIASGQGWKNLPASPGRIEIVVAENNQNGLSSYPVSGTIYCPRFQFDHYTDMVQLKARRILLKYTTANGDVLVVGDKQNPITVTAEQLNPASATGYCGVKFTLSGTMTHSELPLL